MFNSYIPRDERRAADRKLPRLMVEGLLLGETGLGTLALIFEIAAGAFRVAAYQTLLAIGIAGACITLYQLNIAHGGLRAKRDALRVSVFPPGTHWQRISGPT